MIAPRWRLASLWLSQVARVLADNWLRLFVVLELARQATGLSDFGDDDFRPRLDLWLQCAEEDKGLTQFGRNSIFDIVGFPLPGRSFFLSLEAQW